MNDPSGFKYAFKVWIITVLASPIIILLAQIVYDSVKSKNFFTGIPLFFVVGVAGVVLAIPALFFFWFCYVQIRSMSINNRKKKTLLSIIGVAAIFLTILIANSDFLLYSDTSSFLWPGSYAITLVVAIFLVKMKAQVIDN